MTNYCSHLTLPPSLKTSQSHWNLKDTKRQFLIPPPFLFLCPLLMLFCCTTNKFVNKHSVYATSGEMRRHGTLNSIRRTKQLIAVDIWDHSCASQSRLFSTFEARMSCEKITGTRWRNNVLFPSRFSCKYRYDLIYKSGKILRARITKWSAHDKECTAAVKIPCSCFSMDCCKFFFKRNGAMFNWIYNGWITRNVWYLFFALGAYNTVYIASRLWVQCIQIKSRWLKYYNQAKICYIIQICFDICISFIVI